MEITFWPIERPRPYENNPRTISDTAIEKVAASIQQFGWRQPIVVDEDGVIVIGHTRLKAARYLSCEKVPVHVARGLSPEQIRALRIADNRTNEESEWDVDLLRLELGDLEALDFDLGGLGFDEAELGNFMAEDLDEAELERADEVPELSEDAVSKPGDLWILGEHRVICGDATSVDDTKCLFDGNIPHIMVTDPPYGVEYDADWRNRALRADGTPFSGRAIGKVKNDDRADWREAWALFPGDVCYIWHAGSRAHEVADSLIACDFDIRTQIIWKKHHFVISRGHYHGGHEPCWYAVKKGRKSHWCGDHKQSTVWEIQHQRSETGHSTQKPIEAMRKPILNSSNRGDAVYDPFLGSGTTLIAAEIEGRRCFGLELNPAYVDIIVKRWQDYTGLTALHGDGRSFDEIAAETISVDEQDAA